MVVKEWRCAQHGFFEGTDPICPQGCEEDIMQVFLTPVAVKSSRTKKADKTLEQLALDYSMSDIKSVREGEAQPRRFPEKPVQAPTNPFAVQWGRPQSIGNYNLGSIAGENPNGLAAVKQSGVQLTQPKAASYIADHENLKISK